MLVAIIIIGTWRKPPLDLRGLKGRSEDPLQATTGLCLLPVIAVWRRADMDDEDEDADTDWPRQSSLAANFYFTTVTSSDDYFTLCDTGLFLQTTTYRLHMEHPPRAGFRYELLMDEGSGLGMIPRGTTVLVTEGHISLTAVIRIWSWSPIYNQYSWWAKIPRDGHGNRVRGGRASGIRGMISPPAIHGCAWFLGTRLTPPFRSYIGPTSHYVDN